MCIRNVKTLSVMFVFCFAVFVNTTSADEAVKLKTQVVKLVLAEGENQDRHPAIELVQIPAGDIVLKNKEGVPQDHVIKPIWVAKYETTWDEYNVFWKQLDLPENERHRPHTLASRPEMPYLLPYDVKPNSGAGFPADCVHFQAAQKYCAWLARNTGRKFRLPTEAEWEYACRTGGPAVKLNAESLRRIAWFKDNANEDSHPVGKKSPNPWGLYDMLGNVAEYVIRDPADSKGLAAGGSWEDGVEDVHCHAREQYSPAWQRMEADLPKSNSWLNLSMHRVGFRVVMDE